jgi:hypothetical protein
MLHFMQSQRPVENDPVITSLPFQRNAKDAEVRYLVFAVGHAFGLE